MKRVLLVFVFVAMLACDMFAHEVRPAYLELSETKAGLELDMSWLESEFG